LEFKDIKHIIAENAPEGRITKVDLEGPKIILYTSDLPFFIDHNEEVKSLATRLRKRVIVRSNPADLMDPIEAKKVVEEIVPFGSKYFKHCIRP